MRHSIEPAAFVLSYGRSVSGHRMCRQPWVLLLIIVLSAGACGVRRDDSTGTMRRIVADHLHVDRTRVSADTTMGDLLTTRSQFLELIRVIERDCSRTLVSEGDARLRATDDSWKSLRIIDLADMIRPEWSKRLQGKKNGKST